MIYCSASEENIGRSRCNHVAYQNINELAEEFVERVSKDLIKQGYGLDELVYDDTASVRAAVAYYGRKQDLEILINDESIMVLAAIASEGYCNRRFNS